VSRFDELVSGNSRSTPVFGRNTDICAQKSRPSGRSEVDRILPIAHVMWAQIATTLAPYSLPGLAMLAGFVVVYKIVEKTMITAFKLEPKPKSHR
jgi:hypothetical protein